MRKTILPLLALVLALGMISIFMIPAIGDTSPRVWTDKADYAPGDTVVISGSGFAANVDLLVRVTRPDGSVIKGDGSYPPTPGSDTVTTDDAGAFTPPYNYILDGIEGLYTVDVMQGDNVLATTTFTDALGITSVSPNSGPTLGGTSVTITGTGFTSGREPFAVTFGGVSATAVTLVDSTPPNTQLTCTTPAHAAGAVDVNVRDKGGLPE